MNTEGSHEFAGTSAFEPAKRMDAIKYPIRDVVKIAQGIAKQHNVKMDYWLNIGDPAQYGMKCPDTDIIAENVKKALDGNLKGYAPSPGDAELRETIAKTEGCSPDDVFVTEGLSEGIHFILFALVETGGKILLPNPTYPLYISDADSIGAQSVFYNHDGNGEIDIRDLEGKIAGAQLMVIINPNNPLGSVYSESNLAKVVELCAAHGVPVFYDGAYDRLVFRDEDYVDFRKIAAGKIPFIYGSSVSKTHFYPGARVGWIAFHGAKGDEWVNIKDAVLKKCCIRLSNNWEFQKAVAATLAARPVPDLREVKRQLIERKNALLDATKEAPLSYPEPKGAFYAFMKIENDKWKNDWDFIRAAMERGVVLVPGSGFGTQDDGTYFRTTILPNPEMITEAFKIIGEVAAAGPQTRK